MKRKEIEAVIQDYDRFNAYLEDGGEAGMALGLVGDIFALDGDEASDRECLEMVSKVVELFNIKERELV
jgi:hypothetical protein